MSPHLLIKCCLPKKQTFLDFVHHDKRIIFKIWILNIEKGKNFPQLYSKILTNLFLITNTNFLHMKRKNNYPLIFLCFFFGLTDIKAYYF